jgi:hypothetical protein
MITSMETFLLEHSNRRLALLARTWADPAQNGEVLFAGDRESVQYTRSHRLTVVTNVRNFPVPRRGYVRQNVGNGGRRVVERY